jgi:hypothetical protein
VRSFRSSRRLVGFSSTGALQSHGLTFERKMQFAVAWAVIIAGLAFILGRVA